MIQDLRKEGPCWRKYGHLIDDVKNIISNGQQWQFSHVNHSANTVAHRLARMALVIGEDILWNESIPDCIREAVFHE